MGEKEELLMAPGDWFSIKDDDLRDKCIILGDTRDECTLSCAKAAVALAEHDLANGVIQHLVWGGPAFQPRDYGGLHVRTLGIPVYATSACEISKFREDLFADLYNMLTAHQPIPWLWDVRKDHMDHGMFYAKRRVIEGTYTVFKEIHLELGQAHLEKMIETGPSLPV